MSKALFLFFLHDERLYCPNRKSPQREFVDADGNTAREEDFANNVEYFLFEPDVLRAKTPAANDAEARLSYLQQYFANAKFQRMSVPNDNPHSIYDEVSYRDDSAGLVLKESHHPQHIEAIAWFNPAERRNPASSQKKSRPIYKIGNE